MELRIILSQIENENEEEIERLLHEYNIENGRTFSFEQKEEDSRIRLCRALLEVLVRAAQPRCQSTCLETLRILSRDKRVLGPVSTRDGILTLARLARIGPDDPHAGTNTNKDAKKMEEEQQQDVVAVEALKCLCNVVFNSTQAQQVGADVQLAQGLCTQLQAAGGGSAPHEVSLFSLRLLFLLSALRTDVRGLLRKDPSAMALLTDVLVQALGVRWAGRYEAVPAPLEEPSDPQEEGGGGGGPPPPIPAQENERTMEALKVLFNITLSDSNDQDAEHQLRLLVALMRHLLLLRTHTEDKTEEMHSHAVNLLSNIPMACLDVLIDVPIQPRQEELGGKNMAAIQVLLDFMEKRVDRGSNYKEGLTPVLSLLAESSRYHREIRKYIKAKVLPPLKDVSNRPEVGSTIRNKLVRLMTHVDMGVKQSAAEFLFVLCKESVDNLVKYTGYGSAAGLLLSRGLLGGGRGETQYSEDEDSDTDEYKEAKPYINPITGYVEEPSANPLEEMTEEQKECEAQKLVKMIDQLSRLSMEAGTDTRLEDQISFCCAVIQKKNQVGTTTVPGRRSLPALQWHGNQSRPAQSSQGLEQNDNSLLPHGSDSGLGGHATMQQLIKPMGVRKDGTLAPLEETIAACRPDHNSDDSDSD
ncbi:synembryn-B isoform X2 [Engraulis encrasicolus]|uniref:synembryn-B isoform X2 n=1 Tax=Engraulis encrasicolus TaxID=184585 RepID=UPI002FCFBF0B